MTFCILFVCTGNICRSPMAELLFRARTDPMLPMRTASAGTSGLDGWAMDAPSALVLRELGGDGAGHSAQRLTPELVAESDLILTAETAHREVITGAHPLAATHTFTLREFGRLGAGLGTLSRSPTPEDLRTRVRQVGGLRAVAAPVKRGRDDIGDPYGASLGHVRTCGAQIAAAIDAVIDALGLRYVAAALPGAPP